MSDAAEAPVLMRWRLALWALMLAVASEVRAAPMPLEFEPNHGQAPPGVQFLARDGALRLLIEGGALSIDSGGTGVRASWIGGTPGRRAEGSEPLPGRSHYLRGACPQTWTTNVPHFASVAVADLYPGVDVLFHARRGALEYDLSVAPGGDPSGIRLRLEGASEVRIDGQGALVISIPGATIAWPPPFAYQDRDGMRQPVCADYVLSHGAAGEVELSFDLEPFDRRSALVIDPVLTFSTYLGGSGAEEAPDVALDPAGFAYLTGATRSVDFPVASPLQSALAGEDDAFVAKVDVANSRLVYSTFLGGDGSDGGTAIAVDAAGNAYVGGVTGSADFPTVGALQAALEGAGDAFVSKLDPTGSTLVYSTYLGGGNDCDPNFPPICRPEILRGLAVSGTGEVYVAGDTGSPEFPAVNAFQPQPSGLPDVFVARISSTGDALLSSTYLGGSWEDTARAVAVDPSGGALVVGDTNSTDFPLQSPLQDQLLGINRDVFVTRFTPAGSALVFSTYLGGTGNNDNAADVAVDTQGNAYVAGGTESPDFPTASPLQPHLLGPSDGFLAKIDAAGTRLVYSTFLGGTLGEGIRSVAVDASGRAVVAGPTSSVDFPHVGSFQEPGRGRGDSSFFGDAFMAVIDPAGSRILSSTQLGGGDRESPSAVAIGPSGRVVVVGTTESLDFPLARPIQASHGGDDDDAWLAVIDPGCAGVRLLPVFLTSPLQGQAYAETLTCMTGAPPCTFTLLSGAIPAGLGLAPDGTLSGIPTGTGASSFTILATDAAGCVGLRPYRAAVCTTPTSLLPATLPAARYGVDYEQLLTDSGGSTAIRCALATGSLPPDLRVRDYGPSLRGRPYDVGAFDFELVVTDESSECRGVQPFQLTVCGAIAVEPPSVPTATANEPYGAPLLARFGVPPYDYDVVVGSLPPGISLDPSGLLAGTPSVSGSFPFTVRATDAHSCDGETAYVLTVAPSGCSPIGISPAELPDATVGRPYGVTLTATGGIAPYSFALTEGTLPPGLTLSPSGLLDGTPTSPLRSVFTVTATDAVGCAGNLPSVVASGQSFILGLGHGQPNANRLRVSDPAGVVTPVDFHAYAAGQWGVDVAAGNFGAGTRDAILTAPGPGPTLGPHVRAFTRDGVPIPKVTFYAYGTLRYGATARASSIDVDVYEEILTAPGNGIVFGPHVRGWNSDGGGVAPMGRVSFYSHATPRHGASVAGGDLDADAFGEILAAPGPGPTFGPHVRGFDYDDTMVTPLANVTFWAFPAPGHGANVAAGDVDGDGFAEIAAGAGPGTTPDFRTRFRGFDVDDGPVAALPGFDATPHWWRYGARAGLGDVTGDGFDDLVGGPGPDPSATAIATAAHYDGTTLVNVNVPPETLSKYGVNAQTGDLAW